MDAGNLSDLNFDLYQEQAELQHGKQELEHVTNTPQNENNKSEERLREAVNEFTSIFLNQVFSEMRDTVPDSGLIDGGFAEEVFTEMLDEEISKMGASQNTFSDLNEILFQQLNRNLSDN